MRWRGEKKKTEHHPLYGDIPLVEFVDEDPHGRKWSFERYDPEYRPALPPGAIRGDVSKQVFCHAHYVPKYFYVDEHRTCVQCGADFLFGAAEQKFWYERLKFNFNSVAIRCRPCRKKRRSDNALRAELASASEQLGARPEDPHLLLQLARATVACRGVLGEGSLDRAIAACRRVPADCPQAAEKLYWEARCQLLADRPAKARSLFREFVRNLRGQDAKLVRDAERRLDDGGTRTDG